MANETRIDFYVLENSDGQGRLRVACRVTEKAYRAGHRVNVLARDAEEAGVLDDLLWTFSQSSFIPHALATPQNDEKSSPVRVSHCLPNATDIDTLISLANEPIANYTEFSRIAEVVGTAIEDKAIGRTHFRFYRDAGLIPNTHTITSP